MAKKVKKQNIRVVEEWEPSKLQETLDELTADGYTLHSVHTLPNNKRVFVMIKDE